MSKRFTDTAKWEDPWFRKLPLKYKVFWKFLTDRCDNAGVWKVDIEATCFYFGEEINIEEALSEINKGKLRIDVLDAEYWYLTGFISFQYGELREACRPHKFILNLIKGYNLKGYKIPFEYPFNRVKEKDKDKDKEKDKEKEKEKDKDFDVFWKAYPLKKSKDTAKKAWNKIKPDCPLQALILSAIEKAKLSQDWLKDNGQYIPYPSTWLNGKRWEDEYKPNTQKQGTAKTAGNWALIEQRRKEREANGEE